LPPEGAGCNARDAVSRVQSKLAYRAVIREYDLGFGEAVCRLTRELKVREFLGVGFGDPIAIIAKVECRPGLTDKDFHREFAGRRDFVWAFCSAREGAAVCFGLAELTGGCGRRGNQELSESRPPQPPN